MFDLFLFLASFYTEIMSRVRIKLKSRCPSLLQAVDPLLLKSHQPLSQDRLLYVVWFLIEFEDGLIDFIAVDFVERGGVEIVSVSVAEAGFVGGE